MVNAQEWLDKEYPLYGTCQRKLVDDGGDNHEDYDKDYGKTRAEIKILDIIGNELTGELNLTGFNNLTELHCSSNNLTNLDFLKTISYPDKLFLLDIKENNLVGDLTPFSKFINLEKLWLSNNSFSGNLEPLRNLIFLERLLIGNDEEERITRRIYNRFTGSLEPFKNLTKLNELCIEATDIDSGLEYLPDSLNEAQYDSDITIDASIPARIKPVVHCSPKKRPGSKVAKIKEQLKPFNYNLGKWKENYRQQKLQELNQELITLKTQKQDLENNLTNLKTSLETISQKEQELITLKTQLEQEKNDLQTQLNQAQTQITQLESDFLTSQQKVSDLEIKIKNLENSSSADQGEITKLKQQLIAAQQAHQQEKEVLKQKLKQLTKELTSIKQQEQQLTKKVQSFTSKNTQIKENDCSIWNKIKTPLLFVGGIGIIFLGYKLIRSKLKN